MIDYENELQKYSKAVIVSLAMAVMSILLSPSKEEFWSKVLKKSEDPGMSPVSYGPIKFDIQFYLAMCTFYI